jgi:hypothetical protein
MLYLVNYNDSAKFTMIDYQCSVANIKFKAVEFILHPGNLSPNQWMTMQWIFAISSAISLFIVAIFYACIRELRSNVIGKFVLVLAVYNALYIIAVEIDMEGETVADWLFFFVNISNTLWFLAMAYETFVLLKYYSFS